MNFQPANFLQIVADSPEQLRAVDLDRLEHESGTHWPEMKAYLLSSPVSDRVRGLLENS